MSDYERSITEAATSLATHLAEQIDAGTFAGGAR